jgi:hypothetical protein
MPRVPHLLHRTMDAGTHLGRQARARTTTGCRRAVARIHSVVTAAAGSTLSGARSASDMRSMAALYFCHGSSTLAANPMPRQLDSAQLTLRHSYGISEGIAHSHLQGALASGGRPPARTPTSHRSPLPPRRSLFVCAPACVRLLCASWSLPTRGLGMLQHESRICRYAVLLRYTPPAVATQLDSSHAQGAAGRWRGSDVLRELVWWRRRARGTRARAC